MKRFLMFGKPLCSTYAASASGESIERYYASMFSNYFDQTDSQPGSAAVNAFAKGKGTVSRKLPDHWRDQGGRSVLPNLSQNGRRKKQGTDLLQSLFPASFF